MSKAVNSPTARLLQSSRLFSLPRPLPQASIDNTFTTGVYRTSETATRPYPSHQAITTPASSLHRGDWGLKRPLPGRKTRHTSTPHIRVQAQDTYEHITDFASAADHTQVQAKWLEMGIPMVDRSTLRGKVKKSGNFESGKETVPLSAYESELDNTDGRSGGSRWKFKGPWITGMQEGEFQQYVTETIRKRKGAWREYLCEDHVQKEVTIARNQARERGAPLTPAGTEELRHRLRREFTDEKFQQLTRRLRDEHTTQRLTSELTGLISNFLDLPNMGGGSSNKLADTILRDLWEDEGRPPVTHPAAGLSYIRTNAIMENHPIHGPQAYRSPVEARVVRPRDNGGPREQQAKLGVGGVVANDPNSATMPGGGGRKDDANDMTQELHTGVSGGNKIWVHPENAYMDEKGRIRLNVSRADNEAVAVRLEGDELKAIHEAKNAAPTPQSHRSVVMPSEPPTQRRPGKRAFGVNETTRTRVRGFDDAELGRDPNQGQMNREETANRLQDLLRSRQT